MKIHILGQDGVTGRALEKKIPELGHSLSSLETAELIVASPGVPPADYPTANVEIIPEIEFAYRELKTLPHPPTLIAITGTNGKSTLTALLAHILNAPACGNIGDPLIKFADSKSPYLVAELSSYQLETVSTFHPQIAVITNLSPDHISRHPTPQAYAKAKAQITKNQTPSDTLYIDDTNPILKNTVKTKANRIALTSDHPLYGTFTAKNLPGHHNRLNCLAAGLIARQCGLSTSEITKKMNSFSALEHRIEYVMDINQRRIINDSKATNPDAVLAALNSFDQDIVLICCGLNKQIELEPWFRDFQKKSKAIIIFGDIAREVAKFKLKPTPPIIYAKTMDDAFIKALSYSAPKDVILFSPSSSSFDEFENFEDRGRQFKKMVKHYAKTL